MKKTLLIAGTASAFFLMAALPISLVFAQSATTPVFHTQTGVQVYNTAGASIAPGIYYLANDTQIYYYGNSIYYNPNTQTYGSITDPSYISTNYPYSVSSTAPIVGIPNTGAGGNAGSTWLTLAALGMLVLAGGAYLAYRSISRQTALAK